MSEETITPNTILEYSTGERLYLINTYKEVINRFTGNYSAMEITIADAHFNNKLKISNFTQGETMGLTFENVERVRQYKPE